MKWQWPVGFYWLIRDFKVDRRTFVWSRAQTNKVGGYGFMVNPTLRHRILFRHVRNVYYFTDIFMIKLLLITVRYLCHKFIIYCIYIPCQSISMLVKSIRRPWVLTVTSYRLSHLFLKLKKKQDFLASFTTMFWLPDTKKKITTGIK